MMVGLRMKKGALNSTLPPAFLGALSRLTITASCGSRGSTSNQAVPSRRWYWPTEPKLVPSAKVRTCVTTNRATRALAGAAARSADAAAAMTNDLLDIWRSSFLILQWVQRVAPSHPVPGGARRSLDHRANETSAQHAARRRGRDEPVGILLQQEALVDHLLRGLLDRFHVAVVVPVTLFERLARVAGRHPLRLGGREREVGPAQCTEVGSAAPWRADVPARVRAERYPDLHWVDACQVEPILVGLRYQHGIVGPGQRRQHREHAAGRAEQGAEVENPQLVQERGKLHSGDGRERGARLVARDQRSLSHARHAAPGRLDTLICPGVHGHEERPVRRSLIVGVGRVGAETRWSGERRRWVAAT